MAQQEKLSFLGIGPRIALWTFPSIALSLVLAYCFPQFFRIRILPAILHVWIGWILTICGIIFYVATIPTLLNGLKQNKLITKGPSVFVRIHYTLQYLSSLSPELVFSLLPGLCYYAA